jgi:MFS family permease
MLTTLRASLARSISGRMFYGWMILAVASLIMFGTGPGQSHLIGLFFDPISQELGLSRTSIATAYGSATLFAALLLPQMGKLVDRHGPATMLSIVAFGLGAFAIFFSFATGWIYLAIGFAGLRFLGQGSLMLSCANMTSQWFDKKRGFALGLMSLGFPISIALHPPLVQWLIETVGWREAWIWLGISTWIMLIPPILLFLNSRPSDIGLRPDGEAALKEGDAPPPAIVGYTRAEALSMRAFYLFVGGIASLSMLVTSLHVEYTGILKSHGLDGQTAATMFTISGISAAVMMPIVGRLLDILPTKWMFFGGLWVQAASLLAITFATDLSSAILFAVIFGLNNAVTMTYVGFMWPKYFGRKHLGSIQGTGQMFIIFGASIGPIPLGFALDTWGEYDTMLRLLAIIPIAISAVIALAMPHPKMPEPDGQAPA